MPRQPENNRTIQNISKILRVSTATISRALNPRTEHLVAEPLRKRIQTYANEINYQPNQMARNLAQGRTHTIGVILYSAFGSLFFSDYLSKIQWGITAALDHSGYGCKIVILPRGRSLREVDQDVISNGVDGLLLSTICDFTVDRLNDVARTVERRWDRPIVALNLGPSLGSRMSTVSFSNKEAAKKATAYLIEKGHRHIGLIYTDDQSADVEERVQGFQEALKEKKIPFHTKWACQGDFMPASGYTATMELLKRPESAPLTALFCTNDEMAFGAVRALKVLGKRVPDEIAVMGFDGLTMGEHISPLLTTVTQPFFEIAKAGTTLLLDLIQGRSKGPVHISIPSQLIRRESA